MRGIWPFNRWISTLANAKRFCFIKQAGQRDSNRCQCAGDGHTTGGNQEISEQEGAVPLENRDGSCRGGGRACEENVERRAWEGEWRGTCWWDSVPFLAGRRRWCDWCKRCTLASGPRATGRHGAGVGVRLAAVTRPLRIRRWLGSEEKAALPTCHHAKRECEQQGQSFLGECAHHGFRSYSRGLLQRSQLDHLTALVELRAQFRRGGDAVTSGPAVTCGFRGNHDSRGGGSVALQLLHFGRAGDVGLRNGGRIHGCSGRGYASAHAAFIEHGADFGRCGDTIVTAGTGAAGIGASCSAVACEGNEHSGNNCG